MTTENLIQKKHIPHKFQDAYLVLKCFCEQRLASARESSTEGEVLRLSQKERIQLKDILHPLSSSSSSSSSPPPPPDLNSNNILTIFHNYKPLNLKFFYSSQAIQTRFPVFYNSSPPTKSML